MNQINNRAYTAALEGDAEEVKLSIVLGAYDGMIVYGYAGPLKHMLTKGVDEFDCLASLAAMNGHLDIVEDMIEKGATNISEIISDTRNYGHNHIVDHLS